MTINPIQSINTILSFPTNENIYSIFDVDGYIRLNMLYISPISLKHFKTRLDEMNLTSWEITENELIFRFERNAVSFRGLVGITMKEDKIFCLELDFDPIVSDANCTKFLKDIEDFLKQCDACFFMGYFMSIDSEILGNPLSESIGFLATRLK